MESNASKLPSRRFFFVFAIILVVLSALVARPYLNTIILAVIVAYVVQPLYKALVGKIRPQKVRASVLSTLIVLVFTLLIGSVLVLALIRIMSLVIAELNVIRQSGSLNIDILEDATDWLNSLFIQFQVPIQVTTENILRDLEAYLSQVATFILSTVTSIASLSVEVLVNLIIFYALIFLFIPNFDAMLDFVKKISPFDSQITDLYIIRVLGTAKAMAWGLLIIAAVQGSIAGVVFTILGTQQALLFTIVVAVFSFIPFLGTGMVTLPIAVVYFYNGQIAKGVALALTQFILIGNIDTVLRAKLIPKNVSMPLVISLIAILGGLATFGILGLIYGPVIFSLLLTTLEVTRKYYLPQEVEIQKEVAEVSPENLEDKEDPLPEDDGQEQG